MTKRRILYALLGLVLTGTLAWNAFAYYPIQPTRSVAVLGQLGGQVEQVVVDGHFAYASVGPRILTFDITDPASPTVVAQTPPLDRSVDDLQMDGGRLYAISERTLLVFEIYSDGSLAPPVILTFPGTPRVVHHHDMAYLFHGQRLTFWDVSELRQPRFLGDYADDRLMGDLRVIDQRMYLPLENGPYPASGHFLAIFDINEPAAPRYIGQLPPGEGRFRDLRVIGEQLIYLDEEKLSIFDISDETHPRLLGDLAVKANRIAAAGDGGLLLADTANATLLSIDIRDPSQPMYRGSFPIANIKDSWQKGTLLALAKGDRGLEMVGLADIFHPQSLGRYIPDLVSPFDVVATGQAAYVLDTNTLAIVDLTDPNHPRTQKRLTLPAPGAALHLRSKRLYVAAEKQLLIYDIQNPLEPQRLRSISFPDDVTDIASLPDRLYVRVDGGRDSAGLYALDLAGDTAPHPVIHEPIASTIAVREKQGRRYLFAVDSRVTVYEITDETAARRIGQVDLEHVVYAPGVTDAHVQNDLLHLSTGEIVDVSDPAHPRVIQNVIYGSGPSGYPSRAPRQTVLWGSRHYLLTGGLNVSDPALPYMEQHYPSLLNPHSVAMSDEGLLLGAGGRMGLWLLRPQSTRILHLAWEAESGVVTSPMRVETDANACNGQYVVSSTAWDGAVDFALEIPAGDDYYLWARVMGQDWHQNSFLVSFDGGEPFHFEIRPPDGQWHWVQVYPEHDSKAPFFLAQGPHALRFAAREPNSRVDALFLTNRFHLRPIDAVPCQSPPIPTPTPSPTPTPPPIPMPTPPPPPPDMGLRPVGDLHRDPFFHISGPVTAREDILFAGVDNALSIYNTWSLPLHPDLLATLALPGPIISLAVHGDYLYAQARGLVVVDISELNNPRMVAYLSHLSSGDIIIDGDRLYLIAGQTWTVVDIRQPAAPALLTVLHMPLGKVQIAGDQAFILEASDAVGIYNLANLARVEKTGVYQLPFGNYTANRINDLLATEERFYLLSYSRDAAIELTSYVRVHIVDAPRGQLPAARGVFEKEGWDRGMVYSFRGMALKKDSLYVGYTETQNEYNRSNYFLLKLDVRDPDHPREVDRHPLDDEIIPFLATSNRVWGRFAQRLAVFRQRDLHPLTITGNLYAQDVGGAGERAYLWDGRRLHFVYNRNPQHPVTLDVYQRAVLTADMRNHLAYIGRHYGPPEQWDVPSQICVADLIEGPDATCHIAPVETIERIRVVPDPSGYMFLMTQEEFGYPPQPITYIIDARDPEHMAVKGSVQLAPVHAALVPGAPAYVVWAVNEGIYYPHLHIARLDAPDVIKVEMEVEGPIRDMIMYDRTLFILTDSKVQMIDLSAPESPARLSTFLLQDCQGQGHAIRVLSGRVYAAVGRQVHVIDVVDPANPREVGLYNAPDDVWDIHLQPPLVILAAGRAGMINLEEEAPPTILYLPLVRH